METRENQLKMKEVTEKRCEALGFTRQESGIWESLASHLYSVYLNQHFDIVVDSVIALARLCDLIIANEAVFYMENRAQALSDIRARFWEKLK